MLRCLHKTSKTKLAIVARADKRGHYQHLTYEQCCVECGIVVKNGKPATTWILKY